MGGDCGIAATVRLYPGGEEDITTEGCTVYSWACVAVRLDTQGAARVPAPTVGFVTKVGSTAEGAGIGARSRSAAEAATV